MQKFNMATGAGGGSQKPPVKPKDTDSKPKKK